MTQNSFNPLFPNFLAAIPDEDDQQQTLPVKRTLFISVLAIGIALIVGFIAKLLVYLINLVTHIFFYGNVSISDVSPKENHLGWWVIVIPVVGGVIVGLMARYGSMAIRGHGIPEAMEKILTGDSKIPFQITILKPLSAAISIGTGGPFGAEGPIIATGGAFGSFIGQTLNITSSERKILLAAGATAGMTAIFGTPFAAILLAIELLLFEFTAKSFIPVVVACIVGACMHFLLFGVNPSFPIPHIGVSDKNSIIFYALIGLIIGFASVLVTKIVYFIEDEFEKIPVHWMWWPAIGGLAVGIIGFIMPATLGVGYDNITQVLSGKLALGYMFSLCVFKFLSWSVSLGSGTSGGTLAPLLTIGSCLGCLLGILFQNVFPASHIDLSLAALAGMTALFAGASRALLTSIIFALEGTMQENTLLPVMAACVVSYLVSFILMRTTIMTEKISRRGVYTPEGYTPEILSMKKVRDVLNDDEPLDLINVNNTVGEVKEWLKTSGLCYHNNTLIVVDHEGPEIKILFTIQKQELLKDKYPDQTLLKEISSTKVYSLYEDNNLMLALQFMLKTNLDLLPVVERNTSELMNLISYRDILNAYSQHFKKEVERERHIHPKKKGLRILIKGKQFFNG